MRRAAALLGLLGLLVLAGGCTTTEGPEEQPGLGTTTSVTVNEDADVGPSTTTTRPPADCPPPGVGGLPAEGQELSEALGDFDGNGAVDQLFMYATRSGRRPWRLRVVLSSGFGAERELDAPSSRGVPARAVGGFPVGDRDGDIALAVVGSRSSALQVALFAFRNCELVPVYLPDGEHAVFPVGGSTGEGHGLECRENDLVVMTARSRDGRTYTTEQVVYRLDGTSLVETERAEGATLDKREAEPLVNLHYELTCGNLGLGPTG